MAVEFLSVPETAEVLGLTTGRVCQMLRAGVLRGRKLNERAWIVYRDSVDERMQNPPKTGRPSTGKKSESHA